MAKPPFISICIPAKDRADLLRRLLDSIARQTYRDFEVIITDNSADEAVEMLAASYPAMNIRYFRNNPKTEMGGNWNACMERASGTWLKLIHDDDWLTEETSLAGWAVAALQSKAGFLFSAYYTVEEETGRRSLVTPAKTDIWLLRRSPFSLLRKNGIGPPSVSMLRRDVFLPYRPGPKWLVDIESYIRVLSRADFEFIRQPLMCIGIHGGQATNAYFRNPVVEIPESLAMLNPYYPRFCRNIIAYDYCWRLIRNLHIRSVLHFEHYAAGAQVPECFRALIRFQARFPRAVLHNPVCSKLLMILHWLYFNARPGLHGHA